MKSSKSGYERYVQDVSRIEAVPLEREKKLLKTMATGSAKQSEKARAELVSGNLHLVLRCMKEFVQYLSAPGVSISAMDLVAEGNIALVEAASKFDPQYRGKGSARIDNRRGNSPFNPPRFAPYARRCIRNRMRRALKLSRLIHVPEFHFGCWTRMRRLEEEHGGALGDGDLRKKLGISRERLDRVRESRHTGVSMFEDLSSRDDARPWTETVADAGGRTPRQTVEGNDLREFLLEQTRVLPDRTRQMIAAMFLGERKATLEDLSSQFGVSRERCRQVCASGLEALRRAIESKLGGREAVESLWARPAAA
ncbi:MAG: sigma-70 family RNA polymerase sigma factor [Kiritimatiellia bacterium]